MHPILKGALARGASLVPSAVATLLASRLILDRYGVDVFNAYVLVFSMMVLIPLNDLGAGAALTSAVASDGPRDPHTRRVALTSARTLAVSGLALAAVALSLSAFGLWGDLLGDGAFATGAFGIGIAAYGLSFVPGLAQSALLGANKHHLNLLVQGFLAPLMCAGAAAVALADGDARLLVVVPGLAVLALALLNAVIGARVTRLRLLPMLPKLPLRKRHPGARIRGIAGPVLIITLTAPFTTQTDRLILSHFSTSQEVAKYSVALQIFGPLLALIPAAARPLWPMFTASRARGTKPMSLRKVTAAFVVLTALASAVLCLLAGPLAKLIGDDQIDVGVALPLATAGVVTLQAAAMPMAMALMYPAGLRLVATTRLISVPINVLLSILVADHFGAPGPLYVTMVVAFLFQIVPAVVFIRRHGVVPAPDDPVAAAPVQTEEPAVVLDGALRSINGWITEAAPDDRP